MARRVHERLVIILRLTGARVLNVEFISALSTLVRNVRSSSSSSLHSLSKQPSSIRGCVRGHNRYFD